MKKIITFLTIGFLMLLFASHSYAQNYTAYNLINAYMKYWKARGRLIGDENNRDQHNGFMVVGGEAGYEHTGRILNF